MMTKRNFRLLLAAMILTQAIYVALSLAAVPMLPEPLQKFLEAQASEEEELSLRLWVGLGVGVVAIGTWVVALVGLFRFWAPARWMLLFSFGLGCALLPFFGPTVEVGLVTMFNELGMLLSGMVIAASYWSEARVWFEEATS